MELQNDRRCFDESPLRSHDTESIRNIAILGHAGSGKTTLIEALLAKAGEIRSAGSVEKGSTVCDFTDQEKRLRHSLDVHVCHLRHAGREVNLLDTPGYPDFIGRALAVLPAVETAAIVVNAECGAELVTQRMMTSAAERKLCRLIIVNKIDAGATNLERVLARDPRALRPRVPAAEPARAPRRSRRRLLLRAGRGDFPTSRRSRPRIKRSRTASSSSTTRSWIATSSAARSCTIERSARAVRARAARAAT